MAVAVPAALVPVAVVGFDVVPRGFQRSFGCDLEFAMALGMAREVIGECRDGFRVQVQGVEFLRVDRSERKVSDGVRYGARGMDRGCIGGVAFRGLGLVSVPNFGDASRGRVQAELNSPRGPAA